MGMMCNIIYWGFGLGSGVAMRQVEGSTRSIKNTDMGILESYVSIEYEKARS